MKFKIRQPFAIHLERITDVREGNGVKIKHRNIESSYAGSVVELSEADARLHMHKLEPVDGAAKAFIDSYHQQQEEARRLRTQSQETGPSLETRIAGAVVQAMVAAGLVKAQGARA